MSDLTLKPNLSGPKVNTFKTIGKSASKVESNPKTAGDSYVESEQALDPQLTQMKELSQQTSPKAETKQNKFLKTAAKVALGVGLVAAGAAVGVGYATAYSAIGAGMGLTGLTLGLSLSALGHAVDSDLITGAGMALSGGAAAALHPGTMLGTIVGFCGFAYNAATGAGRGQKLAKQWLG